MKEHSVEIKFTTHEIKMSTPIIKSLPDISQFKYSSSGEMGKH